MTCSDHGSWLSHMMRPYSFASLDHSSFAFYMDETWNKKCHNQSDYGNWLSRKSRPYSFASLDHSSFAFFVNIIAHVSRMSSRNATFFQKFFSFTAQKSDLVALWRDLLIYKLWVFFIRYQYALYFCDCVEKNKWPFYSNMTSLEKCAIIPIRHFK